MWFFILSTNLSETFLILRRTERDMDQMCIVLHVKYPFFRQIVTKCWILLTDFRETLKYKMSWKFVHGKWVVLHSKLLFEGHTQISNFVKIRPVGMSCPSVKNYCLNGTFKYQISWKSIQWEMSCPSVKIVAWRAHSNIKFRENPSSGKWVVIQSKNYSLKGNSNTKFHENPSSGRWVVLQSKLLFEGHTQISNFVKIRSVGNELSFSQKLLFWSAITTISQITEQVSRTFNRFTWRPRSCELYVVTLYLVNDLPSHLANQ
jgi:hypothetical protein